MTASPPITGFYPHLKNRGRVKKAHPQCGLDNLVIASPELLESLHTPTAEELLRAEKQVVNRERYMLYKHWEGLIKSKEGR